jgi:hypothetical protein
MASGSLKRAPIVLKSPSPRYWKYVDLCYDYESGENLAFGYFTRISKT